MVTLQITSHLTSCCCPVQTQVFWGGSGSLSPRGLGRWVQRENTGHRHGRAGRAEDVGEPSGPWCVAGPLRSAPQVRLFTGGLISSSPVAGGRLSWGPRVRSARYWVQREASQSRLGFIQRANKLISIDRDGTFSEWKTRGCDVTCVLRVCPPRAIPHRRSGHRPLPRVHTCTGTRAHTQVHTSLSRSCPHSAGAQRMPSTPECSRACRGLSDSGDQCVCWSPPPPQISLQAGGREGSHSCSSP